MFEKYFGWKNARCLCRNAITSSVMLLSAACATPQNSSTQWAAHGYLTPGPTSNPEIIGVYPTFAECTAAGEAWMSRQIVGNPVFAECYPLDRD
jgi:hypothetical protein